MLASAAITKRLEGREIAEIGLLQEAGAIAFTDGARSVQSAQVDAPRPDLCPRILTPSIMHYTEDKELARAGVMNEGEFASRLGLSGIPREAEAIVLDRDMRLVDLVRSRYHAALVSTGLSLEILARAKAAGLPATCGASINHLSLNENDIGDYRTFLKVCTAAAP